MGITASFLLGFISVAVIAAVVFVASRKQERRHELGLAAARGWAETKADTYPSDAFGAQVGRVYQEAINAARASVPRSTSCGMLRCHWLLSGLASRHAMPQCQERSADVPGEGR